MTAPTPQYVVNLNLNGKATKAFGALTETQASKYLPGASSNADDQVLDSTAIVLDGNVVSSEQTQEAIPGGQVQISNIGGQAQANQLVDELKYGALPLSFKIDEHDHRHRAARPQPARRGPASPGRSVCCWWSSTRSCTTAAWASFRSPAWPSRR